ncbi:MAG TPA: hypothetical protein ENL12_00030, partial [Dehalococcoidia bacterium]|nr:hypothetical protein [Dehalococcoidia bacterium]
MKSIEEYSAATETGGQSVVLQSSSGEMAYYLGVDIGSVSVKLCLIDETGSPVRQDVERISTGPRAAVSALVSRLISEIPAEQIIAAGVSGSGSSAIPPEMGWASFSSSLAIASGVLHTHPAARTIIQIGGQSSL